MIDRSTMHLARTRRPVLAGPATTCRAMLLAALVACSLPAGIGHALQTSPGRVRDLISHANRAFERGDAAEALRIYSEIPPKPDRPAEVCYNEGLAHAAEGDLDRALEAFRLADLNATTSARRADARHGMARATLGKAMQTAASNPEGALPELERAAGLYRSVLEVRPDDVEAAKDVERTRLLIQRLKEVIERAKAEQAAQRERLGEMAERMKDLAERQEQAAEQSNQAEAQNEQDSSIGAERSRQTRQEQQQISDETGEMFEELMEQLTQSNANDPSQTPMSEALAAIDQASQEQQDADQQLRQNRPGDAEPRQRTAAERLREAAQRLQEASEGEGGEEGQRQRPSPGESGEEGQPTPDGQSGEERDQEASESEREGRPREARRLGREEGDPIARQLIERELRERSSQRRRGPLVPVERDW